MAAAECANTSGRFPRRFCACIGETICNLSPQQMRYAQTVLVACRCCFDRYLPPFNAKVYLFSHNSQTVATRSDSSGCMLLLPGRESYKLQDDNQSSISLGIWRVIFPSSSVCAHCLTPFEDDVQCKSKFANER